MLLLYACSAAPLQGAAPAQPTTYRTAKAKAEVEKCLADSLSTRGDVTAVAGEGVTTLVLHDGTQPPMLIDIAVPMITITTRMAYGTRALIERCI